MILTLGFAIFVTYWLAKLFKSKPSGIKLILTYFVFFVGVGLLGLAEGLYVSYYMEASNGLISGAPRDPLPSDCMRIFLISSVASLWVIKSRLAKIKPVEVV